MAPDRYIPLSRGYSRDLFREPTEPCLQYTPDTSEALYRCRLYLGNGTPDIVLRSVMEKDHNDLLPLAILEIFHGSDSSNT